jgi:type VI secretion system protein ImpE
MATASELYKDGKLTDAIAATVEQVKAAPADRGRRYFLAELLAFKGDLERADKQLANLISPDAPDLLAASAFRQLLRGETARREVFLQGRVPEFLGLPSESLKLHLEALVQTRNGNFTEAGTILAKADPVDTAVKGTCNGEAFEGIRDLDDLTSNFLEVLTNNGNYYWVPFSEIDLLEFVPPERARDLLWRRAHLIVRNGPDGEVYIPATYPVFDQTDEEILLGRKTEWNALEGAPYRGAGLREYLIGDAVKSILEIESIEFAGSAQPEADTP